MIGPALTLRGRGVWLSIPVLDAVLAVIVLTGSLSARGVDPPGMLLLPLAIVLTGLGFGLLYGVERFRLRLARHRPPVGGCWLTMAGVVGVTVEEATGDRARIAGGVAGMAIDLAGVLLFGGIAWAAFDRSGTEGAVLGVFATALAAVLGLRLLPALGLDGGRILTTLAELVDNDEGEAGRLAGFVSILIALALWLSGLAVFLALDAIGYWGLGLMVIAVQTGAAAPWTVRRTTWIERHASTPVTLLPSPTYPTVLVNAGTSELVSVVAVEGPSVLIVAVSGRHDLPAGVVRGRDVGRIVRRAGEDTRISEVMTPLSDLHRVPACLPIVEAVRNLEGQKLSYGVVEDDQSGFRVVTRAELIRL